MNARLLFRFLAVLSLLLCLFMLAPVIVALAYGEGHLIESFLTPVAVLAPLAVLVLFLTRRDREQAVTARTGFLLVSLAWVLAAVFGAFPFFLSGAFPSFTDAFFESMSGFTTTGASILTTIEGLPRSMLFWRSLTHWLGGMGIVVLTVAVLPVLGIGALQLIQAEAPGPSVDRITPKVAATAKVFWLIYLGLTVAETVLLLAGGMDLFDSLTHTFGTLATGGFSPKNTSVGFYDSAYIDGVITVFMLLAGISFALHFRLLTGRPRYLWRNTELKVYLAVFLAATLLTALSLNGPVFSSWGRSLRFAGFQVASILTTTGFATANFAEWPELARGVLFLLMFIGGSAGSTGGGIKVVRWATLFKLALVQMRSLIYPRGVFTFKINGESVRREVVFSITGFFFLYIGIVMVVTLVVAAAGNDIVTSLTSSLAIVGNIGPGFGRVGPALNYAFFPDPVKWVLSLAMMIGRLEVYTVLILFMPGYWKR